MPVNERAAKTKGLQQRTLAGERLVNCEYVLPPWAHDPRLQQLRPLLLTTHVSNKSRNLLLARSYPEWHENFGFLHGS
jgi:hypothetical protein